jgi:hypothetical protein
MTGRTRAAHLKEGSVPVMIALTIQAVSEEVAEDSLARRGTIFRKLPAATTPCRIQGITSKAVILALRLEALVFLRFESMVFDETAITALLLSLCSTLSITGCEPSGKAVRISFAKGTRLVLVDEADGNGRWRLRPAALRFESILVALSIASRCCLRAPLDEGRHVVEVDRTLSGRRSRIRECT